ncbi:hypothetical protein WJX74_007320 [Apatococcus lobatus]|uniref:Uncharacterized protein n=1 Tax=Apatococcus lobatus TaxID=904363 RepID=A0AAW1RL02_9CHLO
MHFVTLEVKQGMAPRQEASRGLTTQLLRGFEHRILMSSLDPVLHHSDSPREKLPGKSPPLRTLSQSTVLRQKDENSPRERTPSSSSAAKNLRKSMGSASLLHRTTSTASSDSSPNGVGFELTRMRNDLRSQGKELDAEREESRTLRSKLNAKEQALTKISAENTAMSDRLLRCEADLSTRAKELRTAHLDRQRAVSAKNDAEMQADKLQAKMAAMPKGPKFSEQVASLESEVRSLRQSNAKLTEDNKAAAAMIRNKDRELDAAAVRVEEAEQVMIMNRELENRVRDQLRRLEEAAAERATLQAVVRQRDAQIQSMTDEVARANAQEATMAQSLASANTLLKDRGDELSRQERELKVTRDELIRTGAVAQRVAASETRGGNKDEGVVPVAMHLEEVKHLQGELERVTLKLRQADKSAAANQQIMDKLHKQLDAKKQERPAANSSMRRSFCGSPLSIPAVDRSPSGMASPRLSSPGSGTVKPMTPLSHQLQIEKLSKELASKDAELASLRNEHSRQEPRLIALRDANRRLERQISQLSQNA